MVLWYLFFIYLNGKEWKGSPASVSIMHMHKILALKKEEEEEEKRIFPRNYK